jgi:ABC-type sugar transport system substrate-binding protein
MRTRGRIICLIGIYAIFTMIFYGCAYGGTRDKKESAKTSNDFPHYKVGVMLPDMEDNLTKRIMSDLSYISNNFNCEFVYVAAPTPDVYLSKIESLCEIGVDGIITCNTGKMTDKMLNVCEKHGVYLVVSHNDVSNDAGYDNFSLYNKYYCGCVYENDYRMGYDIAANMIARGAKTFCLNSLPLGVSTQIDGRFRGGNDAIVRGGGVLGEAHSFSQDESAKNLLNQFPDVDAIYTTGSGIDKVAQAVKSIGREGDILINSFECSGDALRALQDNDVQYVVEGQYVDTMFSFILLYNVLRGTPLKPEDGSPVAIMINYVVITSADQYKDYERYVAGGIPAYTKEELKQFICFFNKAASYEALKEAAESFSLNEVKRRHKNLIDP